MQANFEKCLVRILAYEGGKVNDPHDPGGRTNQGITQGTYTAWLMTNKRPVGDVFNIPDADRDSIYKTEFWDRIQGDALPNGLDLVVFDAAVNSGPGQAIKWLQQSLGTSYTGFIDGVMGAKTLDAVDQVAGADVVDLIEGYCSRRLATLKQLKTWPYFSRGWAARIANVQKASLSWVDQSPTVPIPDLSGVKGSAKAPVAGQIKPPVISQIASHAITAGGAISTVAAQASTGLTSIPSDTFAWLKYILGFLTLASVGGGVLVAVSTNAKAAAEQGAATTTVDLEADTQLPAITPVVPQTAKGM